MDDTVVSFRLCTQACAHLLCRRRSAWFFPPRRSRRERRPSRAREYLRFGCHTEIFACMLYCKRERQTPESCVLLQAMVRNAEVRFVFRGRIKESDQVLGMSDPGARAERGLSSPERSALKVENHKDFRPHRAVPEADGDEMPLEPDGPSVLLPRKTSSPAHFVLKAKRSCLTNPHLSKK